MTTSRQLLSFFLPSFLFVFISLAFNPGPGACPVVDDTIPMPPIRVTHFDIVASIYREEGPFSFLMLKRAHGNRQLHTDVKAAAAFAERGNIYKGQTRGDMYIFMYTVHTHTHTHNRRIYIYCMYINCI